MTQYRLPTFSFSCLLPLLVVFSCSSCNNAPSHAISDSTKAALAPAKDSLKQTDAVAARQKLIQALQQLQQDVAGKNRDAIAAYFRFPVQSDALQVFDVGEAFDNAVQKDHYQVSQPLFLSNFAAIYNNLEMQGLTDMFTHLALSKLKDTATRQIQANKNEGVCIYSYNIVIEGKEVTLQYGVNTDEAYTSKHMEEDPECLEYAAFWIFVFDGTHLVFNRHQVAG